MMHIPTDSNQTVVEIWFAGDHGDLGKQNKGRNLMEYPIAALLQHIKNALPEYPMNSDEFGWFTSYRVGSRPTTPSPVQRRQSCLMSLMGMSARTPGRYSKPGHKTNEFICSSVRCLEASNSGLVP